MLRRFDVDAVYAMLRHAALRHAYDCYYFTRHAPAHITLFSLRRHYACYYVLPDYFSPYAAMLPPRLPLLSVFTSHFAAASFPMIARRRLSFSSPARCFSFFHYAIFATDAATCFSSAIEGCRRRRHHARRRHASL
jgi:hypothetical protein